MDDVHDERMMALVELSVQVCVCGPSVRLAARSRSHRILCLPHNQHSVPYLLLRSLQLVLLVFLPPVPVSKRRECLGARSFNLEDSLPISIFATYTHPTRGLPPIAL